MDEEPGRRAGRACQFCEIIPMASYARVIAAVLIVAVFVSGVAFFIRWDQTRPPPAAEQPAAVSPVREVIGYSVQGRPIEAYTYSAVPLNGSAGEASTTKLLFVGGIHGGYEWNSALLAYDFIDYLSAHPDFVPRGMNITVIPEANPDAVFKVTGKEGRFNAADVTGDKNVLTGARFNADGVDLNRNFDCKWSAISTWQNKRVSGGTAPFSEPESRAIRDFVLKTKPAAVVFWHSQSGNVYASACRNGILQATLGIMNAYAAAAGYGAIKTFDAYATSGAGEDWLASIGIPALTVELTTHQDVEFEKNLAGVKAVIGYFEH